MTVIPATPVLDGLQTVAGGFGQPTFARFYEALVCAARERATSGEPPPVLLVMGEPLAGKSTFLSQLFVRLTTPHRQPLQGRTAGGEGEPGPGPPGTIRPYLVRWGDTIRAAKQLGQVAAERQFGDLTPEEFARTSALLAGPAASAQNAARSQMTPGDEQAAQGNVPALVVIEAPGVTMLTDASGQTRGLDRGYSLARALAQREDGYLMVLCADQQVREANIEKRAARLAAGSPDVREATQLAANRIRQQVTDLLYDLAIEGKLRLPGPAPDARLSRAHLDADPAYRNEGVVRAYLPYLLEHDLKVPAERAFIGLNRFLGGDVAPDVALLDAYDWTHRHFDIGR